MEIGSYIASSVAIDGNQAFFGNYDGEFFCVDYVSKKIVWTFKGQALFLHRLQFQKIKL